MISARFGLKNWSLPSLRMSRMAYSGLRFVQFFLLYCSACECEFGFAMSKMLCASLMAFGSSSSSRLFIAFLTTRTCSNLISRTSCLQKASKPFVWRLFEIQTLDVRTHYGEGFLLFLNLLGIASVTSDPTRPDNDAVNSLRPSI